MKHQKFVPGVKIPIFSKNKINGNNIKLIILAWNFYDEIKKQNLHITKDIISIKELEKDG